MFCPKCKDSFVEGSRRFCPTDGTRLVAESMAAGNKGGIFSNLIPKMDALSELNENSAENARVSSGEPNRTSPEQSDNRSDSDDFFFELDDIDSDTDNGMLLRPVQPATPSDRPAARKVHPGEIPKGHADLRDVDRYTGPASDFDERRPESLVRRTVKGRYRVTQFLGGDENGLAYLADDQIVGDKKVLVRILIGTESDEIMNGILAEERVSLSHFSHPNIARLIDSGQFTNGPHFLVSEYVDALSAAEILHIHGHFDRIRAARVVRQAANALNEAHQAGILHRDVRPENLIINVAEGEPEQTKLVNFGASTGEPNPHNIAYKSQELLDGRIATIASDIHSLAVVAYQMLTGRVPFAGSSARDLVRAQKAGLKVFPTQIRPELPAGVDAVFEKAFSNNPVDRYPRARDLGDAFYAALTNMPSRPASTRATAVTAQIVTETLKPLAPNPIADTEAPARSAFDVDAEPAGNKPVVDPPAWMIRSPEPPQDANTGSRTFFIVGALALLALVAAVWYYAVYGPDSLGVPSGNNGANSNIANSPSAANAFAPPQPRNVAQPPDTDFYQNNKQNLTGDLIANFVGFTLYYPKNWKVNGPQAGDNDVRGKFLDITNETADGRLKEQMLVSYYESRGTYQDDADKFPILVNETNQTLAKLLPDYKMVSQGETKINGDWRAYEIKFESEGIARSGQKLVVWGRRLYIPAARPGTKNGFEITMLATSLADGVTGVNDVGVKGELATILNTFEPSQTF